MASPYSLLEDDFTISSDLDKNLSSKQESKSFFDRKHTKEHYFILKDALRLDPLLNYFHTIRLNTLQRARSSRRSSSDQLF